MPAIQPAFVHPCVFVHLRANEYPLVRTDRGRVQCIDDIPATEKYIYIYITSAYSYLLPHPWRAICAVLPYPLSVHFLPSRGDVDSLRILNSKSEILANFLDLLHDVPTIVPLLFFLSFFPVVIAISISSVFTWKYVATRVCLPVFDLTIWIRRSLASGRFIPETGYDPSSGILIAEKLPVYSRITIYNNDKNSIIREKYYRECRVKCCRYFRNYKHWLYPLPIFSERYFYRSCYERLLAIFLFFLSLSLSPYVFAYRLNIARVRIDGNPNTIRIHVLCTYNTGPIRYQLW